MTKAHPEVTFFVESREQAAEACIVDPEKTRGKFLLEKIGSFEVKQALQQIRGRIAIALNKEEISNDGALLELLRELNSSNIQFDLWANLTDQDGYFVHAGNVEIAARAIERMLNELDRKNIDIDRVGLDLEFPAPVMLNGLNLRAYCRIKPWRFSQRNAQEKLAVFIEKLLKNGYGVDTYEIPILGDWRMTRKLLGIPEAPPPDIFGEIGNRYQRIGLVYTSAKPGFIPISPETFVQRYSTGKGRIPALGIVSAQESNPGRNIEGTSRLLSTEDFERDMRAALTVSPERVCIFALDGSEVISKTQAAINKALKA